MTMPQEQKTFCPSHPNAHCPMTEGKGRCGLCGMDFSAIYLDRELRDTKWEAARVEGEKKKAEAQEQHVKEERDKARWEKLAADAAHEEQIKNLEALSNAWETDAYRKLAEDRLVMLKKHQKDIQPPPQFEKPPATNVPPPFVWTKRSPATWIGVGLVSIFVVAGGSYGHWQDKQAEVARLKNELHAKTDAEAQASERASQLLAQQERERIEQEKQRRQAEALSQELNSKTSALKEAEERAALIEKNLKDMQRLAALKREEAELTKPRPAAAPSAQPPTSLGYQAGQRFKDCADCPEMVVIPAGSFDMGSPESEVGHDGDEGPVHRVTIGKAFALGRTEVTQGQWKAVMGSPPSALFARHCGDECPVDGVSWNDAKEFIQKLNAKTGKQYRLPTEAEWEYAARAGTTTPFYTGNCINKNQANLNGNANDYDICGATRGVYRDQQTIKVGSFSANAYGLYDMSGNVGEWVQDCYHSNYNGAPGDGSEWKGSCNNDLRVTRGGSVYQPLLSARSAKRLELAVLHALDTGFRLARTLP